MSNRLILFVKTFLAVLIVGIPSIAVAQGDWTITLTINPYPSPYLSDWESNPSIGNAFITNNTDDSISIIIFLTINRLGTGTIASGNSNPFVFPPGSSDYIPTTELVDYGSIDYDHDLESTALRTGRLPEGEYEICIRLEDTSGNPLLGNTCASFTIIYPDPPYLAFPFSGEIMNTSNPVFQWMPVQVPAGYQIHYSIKIVELFPDQLPSLALEANYPHYTNTNILSTSLQYPLDALAFENGKTYVWQVQVLDQNDVPPSSNEGKSEIWTFNFGASEDSSLVEPPPAGDIVASITHLSSASGIFQQLFTTPFDSILAALSAAGAQGEISIPLPVPDLDIFPDITIPNALLEMTDSSFALAGESDLNSHPVTIELSGWEQGTDGNNSYDFRISLPEDISVSDLLQLTGNYLPSIADFPLDFPLIHPAIELKLNNIDIQFGVSGSFEIGQLTGSSTIGMTFADGDYSLNCILENLPDNINLTNLISAADSLLTDWNPPSTGEAFDWINSLNLELSDLNLEFNFPADSINVDISGAFETGDLQGRAGFLFAKSGNESSIDGFLEIEVSNLSLQSALSLADSLMPVGWSMPSGPAMDWVESLNLNFPEGTLSLSFGDDHFGVGLSGSFESNQRFGTASLAFSQTGQQTSLSFSGAFDNNVSFSLNDAYAFFPDIQPIPLDMPWLESLTLSAPTLHVFLSPDSLLAGISGSFTAAQRSGTAGLVYTQAGDEPSIRATVTFNQDASFALSDMIDLLPSSWPAPGGEVFDWLGSLGLNIPGITLELLLHQDCAEVTIFGPFAIAGQQGSARLGFDYCGDSLTVSGGLHLETQQITFGEALAMADSLLPNWTTPSGPVFQKIESLGLSLPSAIIDLSFSIDSLQLGLSGPFSFGSGEDEQEGTSDIKMVKSQGVSSLLGGLNLNLSSIDLPAIMNTITNLLPDGWTLPAGPAIDRLQSLNLNFLQGASLGMHFNPSGWIDFDLLGPFHFGGGGSDDNEGESELELTQNDDGYSLGGVLNFTLPEADMPAVMDLISNLLPDDWSPASLPSIDWLNSFNFAFDHPSLNVAFPHNGFNINFNGPFNIGQGNNSKSGTTYFSYLYSDQSNLFSGGINFNLNDIDFPSLVSFADSLLGDRWSLPSGPVMDMIQSMDLTFPEVSLTLGFGPETTKVGIDGSFNIGEQQGAADLSFMSSGGETAVDGGFSLNLQNIDYPGMMAVADSLLPENWNPPSGPAAQAIESLDLSFPQASLIVAFDSDNFDIGISGSFIMGQRAGDVGISFSTTDAGTTVLMTGSFGPNETFSLTDLTSMFSPGQLSQQMDWLQSIQISSPILQILAGPDSIRASVSGAFILNQKPGMAEISVSTTDDISALTFTGAFNNNVSFSFADILALLPGDMSSLTPPVDIELSGPRITMKISSQSFSTVFSGNLEIAGRTGSASMEFKYADGGPSLVFRGTIDHLSSNGLFDFVESQTGVSDFSGSLPEDLLEFNDLTITIGVGQDNRFSIAANSSFMGQETSLLLSVVRRTGHPPSTVVGLRPAHWSLSEAFPSLSNPLIDGLDFSSLGLIFSQGSDTVESSELSPEERQFYGGIRGTDDFNLNLSSGVKLMGTILPSSLNPDGPLVALLDLLGGGDEGLYLEGSLPLGFGRGGGGSLDGLSLSLSLPPMSPPNPPDWFESGNLSIEILGSPIGVSLVGSIMVNIDEQLLTFFVRGMVTTSGGVTFSISGGLLTEEPWEQPFGIEWLTFNRAMAMIGVNAVGNISLGFRADMVIGQKDMDVAVLVVVNASGVPTNFMLDGESEDGFGMSDIAELQHRMAEVRALAEGNPVSPMLPIELLPAADIKSCRLKFAPRDEPALDITRGMAIAGDLYLSFQPGAESQNFAGIDMGVEDMKIYAAGHLAAFTLGPIIWHDAIIDLNLELGASHFIVDGQAEFLGNMQQIQVNMTRDSLLFHTATQIDGRFSTDLAARGIFNLTNPSFQAHGIMQSNFNGHFAQILADGLTNFAGASDQIITATLDAYNQVAALHAQKQLAIDSLTVLLNSIRQVAQSQMDEAQDNRDQAYSEKASALSQKNNAHNSWDNTPRTQPALRAQRWGIYINKSAIYASKAGIYAAAQANYLAKQAIYNAIPSPDTDPILIALREHSDQLWEEMENRIHGLEQLQASLQQINDYLDQQSGPLVTIQGAEFDANLGALSGGGVIQMAMDLTIAGEGKQMNIEINLQDEAAGLAQLISSIVEGI